MTDPTPGMILAAKAERENARRLLDEHLDGHGKTWTGGCDKCASLDGHLRRTEAQLRLLVSGDAETALMW